MVTADLQIARHATPNELQTEVIRSNNIHACLDIELEEDLSLLQDLQQFREHIPYHSFGDLFVILWILSALEPHPLLVPHVENLLEMI